MDSSKPGSSRGPVTRRRAAEEQKENEDKKRGREMCQPREVIEHNDIIVGTNKGEIKIEEEDVDVKPAVDPVHEEISSGHLDLEEHETTPALAPVVKVEYIEGDANIQDGIRNFVLEEIDLPMDCSDIDDGAGLNEVNNDEVQLQCGSNCREEIEMLKSVLQDQNQKIEVLMTRVTENEKELAELRGRLQKHEKNTALSLPSDVDDYTVLSPSNSTKSAYEVGTTSSSVISKNTDKAEITDDQSNLDAETSSMSSDCKVIDLFPEVIRVFWTKYAKGMENSKSYLNLNCRLVCQSWRDGIDYLLMTEEGLVRTCVDETVKIDCNWDVNDYEGKIEETVNKIFEKYENKIGWRFLQPKTLHVRTENGSLFDYFDKDLRCRTAINRFLEKFGSGIETFSHFYWNEYQRHYESYLNSYISPTFKSWILQMPNLKYFIINQYDKCVDPDPYELEPTKIQEYLQLHSFPKLDKLTKLKFIGPTTLSSVMIPIVSKNNQISSFESNMSFRLNQSCLPNLTHLSIIVTDSDNNISTFLPLMLPNLKSLKIDIKHYERISEEHEFTSILRIVSQLVCLERLELVGICAKSLNRFEVFDDDVETSRYWFPLFPFKGTIAQCKNCLQNRLVSKLWEMNPSLKWVEVGIRTRPKHRSLTYSTKIEYFSFQRV